MVWECVLATQIAIQEREYWHQRRLMEPYRQLGLEELKRSSGIHEAQLGVPMRLKANCRNCGAPHEPVKCSYCLTPVAG